MPLGGRCSLSILRCTITGKMRPTIEQEFPLTESTIVGAVVTALEPAAAQLLEQLHADLSAEITRLEAEMPKELDSAATAVQYWVGDAKTVLHKFIAKIDQARGGASTEPQQIEQLPEGQTAQPTGPAASAPNGTQVSDAVPPTQPSASTPKPSPDSTASSATPASPTSSPSTPTTASTAAADAKPSA
jgi:hypothetical protein